MHINIVLILLCLILLIINNMIVSITENCEILLVVEFQPACSPVVVLHQSVLKLWRPLKSGYYWTSFGHMIIYYNVTEALKEK